MGRIRLRGLCAVAVAVIATATFSACTEKEAPAADAAAGGIESPGIMSEDPPAGAIGSPGIAPEDPPAVAWDPPELSEHGIAAARDFIRQFGIILDLDVALGRINGGFAAFDRRTWQELEIELPSIRPYGIADSFILHDLDGDGIPEIVIVWNHGMEVGVPFTNTLHVYANGGYVEVFESHTGIYFMECDMGYVYLVESFWTSEWHRVTFDDGRIRIGKVAVEDREFANGVTAREGDATRFFDRDEFGAMVGEGDWEHLRGDFPEFALWLDRRAFLRHIPPLEFDALAP